MPTGIAPSDKKLLIAGGAAILLLLLAITVLSPPPEQFQSPVPSSYSSGSAGAAAAYRLLGKLHYPVRRWESPPTELDGDPSKTLLILAEPTQPADKSEKDALAKFVEDGGHVLFTGAGIREYFPDANLSKEPPDPAWKSFAAELPTRITRDAQHITMRPQAFWSGFSPAQLSVYGDSDGTVVVSWAKGKGNILWWAGSTPLSNAGITHEDNLAFFLNSVGRWNKNEPYHIYWDEYFHGQRSSLWGYVGKTSLAWSALQLGLLAIAIFWTFGRRSGPVFVPAEASRLSPLEFVDTLGGLYERAGAASSAVSIAAMQLRGLLVRQLGLPASISNAELTAAAESRLGWKDSGLAETLSEAAAAAHHTKFSPKAALALVQRLEEFTARLDLRRQIRREKN
jgi:Domain of unknown function (DUF4350)